MVNKKGIVGQCIFCNYFGKLSKEDFWPKWLRKHIPSPIKSKGSSTTFHSTSVRDVVRNTPITISTRGVLSGKRHPSSGVLQVVCAECNNNWMSVITNSAKNSLLKIIHDKWDDLNETDIKCLASWSTLFTMVVEFSNPALVSTTLEERRYFKETRTPGDHWQIYAGRFDGNRWRTTFWHRSVGFYLKEVWLQSPNGIPLSCNFQATTFCIGKGFFHTVRTIDTVRPDPIATAGNLGAEIFFPGGIWRVQRPHIAFDDIGISRLLLNFWNDVGAPVDEKYLATLRMNGFPLP